jgi:hypothetical protein
MPGLKHQSIVQILRDEPQLVVMFLGRAGFRLPSGAVPVIVDSDLSHRGPDIVKELLSDNVFLFHGMHEKVAVVVEVQTSRPNHERQLTWPCYVTSARAVYDCRAYMLVVAASRDALMGSDRVIEIGQPGFSFLPFISGHDRMPPPGGPFFGPELTMLHVLTGTLDLSIHEARMFALASIAEALPDRYRRYVHLIRIFTPRNARQELEQLMEDLFKDPFIDRFLEEGKQLGIERGMQQGMEQGMQQGMEQGMQQGMEQGMQQGMEQGKQQGMEQGKQLGRADSATRVLLTILAARGISIADQLRTRIAECADPDLLESWATRAATSTTIDEVFAS